VQVVGNFTINGMFLLLREMNFRLSLVFVLRGRVRQLPFI